MNRPTNLLAIIGNTFTEALRQPIYGVVIGATILLIVLSPSLVMFTLDDDNQLLKDIYLSTLLVAGLLLGVFASATVVSEEIESKTALTILSKTVGRALFILGKFLGVLAAVLLAEYLLVLVTLIAVRHGVLQTASETSDPVVLVLGGITALATLLIGLGGNYFYRWRFSSTAIYSGSLIATVAVAVLSVLDRDWHYDPAASHLAWDLLGPIVLTLIAVMILTALAVAFATRLPMIFTLVLCFLILMMGVMLDHWLGPIARSGVGWMSHLAWIPLTLIPNLSFYQVTNVIYQDRSIPWKYFGQTALYGLLYVGGCLVLAIAWFRRRELG
ncbi:MAG: hypothetical protein JW810_13360 [Sedimentisphaerales bacterium]|nr:hypothetical protein [Sedimentisphaerales bacterium]